MAKKIWLSVFLLFVVLSASVYFIFDDTYRIDIKETYSSFSVYENGSWELAGEERTVLLDGTKRMRASERIVNYTVEDNITTAYRYAFFKNNITVIDKYIFDGTVEDVELFPVSHEITVLGAERERPYILLYEVSKLGYYGATDYEIGSAHEFEHNMKVEWEEGNYYKRLYKYKNKDEGKLEIKYRIDSNNFTKDVRLFDPIIDVDTVFTELIFNEADIDKGIAIYEINNPVDNLSVEDLYHTYDLFNGSGLSRIDVFVEVTEEIDVPKYTTYEINYSCEKFDNITQNNYTDICTDTETLEAGYKKEIITTWKQVEYLDKGKNKVKIVGYWNELGGVQSIDWYPNLVLDKDKYDLPKDKFGKVESKFLKQNKWAWWNVSWLHYKEYTNLTGNITYMEINKTANDAVNFTDTRFISCYNDTLIFNHTLEAIFNSVNLGQFRVNNLAENCTRRYYNNSIVSSTSNASDVYFEPVSAYYLDANANDFVGSNDGSVTGATLTIGYINGSYSFDGTNDYISISDSSNELKTATDGSAVLWINTDTVSAQKVFLASGDSGSTGTPYFFLAINNDELYLSGNDGTNNVESSSGAGLTTGTWYHVVITNTGSTNNFYLNSVLQSKSLVTGTAGKWFGDIASTNTLAIGVLDRNGDHGYWDGKLDEVKIYDYPLTQEQIIKIYTQTAPIVVEGPEQNQTTPDPPPVVVLNSPANNSNISTTSITFNGTAYDDLNLINVSLIIDGVLNETNSSGINNSYYIFTKILSQGIHNWTYEACDNLSQCTTANENYFEIDSIAPEINITFPVNGTIYSTQLTQLNLTISDINNDTCIYSFDKFVTNSTFGCNETTLNITGLTVNETNQIDIFANDTFGNLNLSTVIFYIDTDIPNVTILFPENKFYEINLTELNYTVIETIPSFCWNSLDNGTTNSSLVTSGENFTGLSSIQGINYWTVYCNDSIGRIGFDKFEFYVLTLILLADGSSENQTSELGTSINISAAINLVDIFVDVDHPDYGINYSSGFLNTSFNLIIDYFRKSIFNDSTTSKVLSYSGEENKTVYFPAHQWDEVDNMSINISGDNQTQYPENVLFYKSNTSEVDRIFPGFLVNSFIYLTKQIDGELNQTLFYQNPGSQLVSFLIDDNAEFISFIFNVTGLESGVEYEDDFDDEIILDVLENEGMFRGGFALPIGNNLKSFIYDNFITASNLNSSLWNFITNGNYYVCGDTLFISPCDPGDQWLITINNLYADNNLAIYNLFEPDVDSPDQETETVNNNIYVNFSRFNIWTVQEIDLEIYYLNTGDEKDSVDGCTFNSQGYLGEVLFWESPLVNCEGSSPQDCLEYSRSLENFSINLKRNINNSWNIIFYGSEETYGNEIGAGNCNSYSWVYNYTNNSLSKTYQSPGGSCPFTNSIEFLDNKYILENLEFNTLEQFKFNQHMRGFFNGDANDGCNSIESSLKIKSFNYSIYNLSNSSIVSNTVFNSAGDLSRATMNISLWDLNEVTDAFYLFLSADGGINWESVSNGVEHIFSNQGTDLRYKINFSLGEEGYLNNTIFAENLTITTPKGFPTNVSFDFGNNGIEDFTFDGELNSTNSPITVNISSANLTSALSANPILYDHLISVPLKVTSTTIGELNLTNFNVTYNPNPIVLNITYIWNYLLASLGFVDFPIQIESIYGNITLDDVRYDYAGGNSTIEVLAHNDDYSVNDSLNLTYHYSRWEYEWVPYGVEWIYFAPKNSSAQNVKPYGQTETIPILNLTNYGYGGLNATLSIYQNDSAACVNTTMSLDNNKSNGVLLIEDWVNLTSMEYLQTEDIYLFADYNCSDNTWVMFEPQYYFRLCVEGGLCDTQLI